MNAEQQILFRSKYFDIVDFRCKCIESSISARELQETFSVSYIRKGNFIYNIFRNSLDAFNGYFLIDKPYFEHTVEHFDNAPDECTVFRFNYYYYQLLKTEFNEQKTGFFHNNDIHSILVKAGYETEFLHNAILHHIKIKSQPFLIEELVYELIYKLIDNINNEDYNIQIADTLKRYHLTTIEKAKEYISCNYENDISLDDIARNSYVSPYHFSRIFKIFTSYSPYQYLLNFRLKNAEMMIKNTDLPITEICFACGFNNLENFSAAFKKKFLFSPQSFRLKKK
jgi:AraC-like DNA-binding protein